MKLHSCIALGITAFAGVSSASAQLFEIPWYTVDAGGGTSVGSGFELTGTVGQPDAGPELTSGNYLLEGGFWYGSSGPSNSCRPDFTHDGVLDFFDVSAFLAAYSAMDPSADFATPFGVFDFFDVSAFITAFERGCP